MLFGLFYCILINNFVGGKITECLLLALHLAAIFLCGVRCG